MTKFLAKIGYDYLNFWLTSPHMADSECATGKVNECNINTGSNSLDNDFVFSSISSTL